MTAPTREDRRLAAEHHYSPGGVFAGKAERDEARKNYQFMVDRASDEKLDGYRELAALAAAAENERDDLRRVVDEFRTVDIPAHVAEIDRLRGALEASTSRRRLGYLVEEKK